MDRFQAFSELVAAADRNKWCIRPVCTTCGAHAFRTALREIPREDVIAGLRLLSRDFLSKHADMFRLVVLEISFGVGGELLESLQGTPAGDQLRSNIDYQHRRHEEQQAYLSSQTQEAIAERRAAKKAARMLSTAPHRERKSASRDAIRAAAQELNAIPAKRILELLAGKDFGAPLQAIGGLVYERLKGHYKVEPIQSDDLRILSRLADLHNGHWKKLLDRVKGTV